MKFETLPDYCCAILEAPDGRLLMEWRGPEASRAAGKLTFLGGRREPGEEPGSTILRELREEVGWVPDRLEPAVILEVEGRLTAWFYHGRFTANLADLTPEPGLRPILIEPSELPNLPTSPWHRAVWEAFRDGRDRVRITGGSSPVQP